MKCTISIVAALLFCHGVVFAQYTNLLEGGTEQTVNTAWSSDTVWVGNTTPSNKLFIVSGGVVTSTNLYVGATGASSSNTVSVTGTASWTIEDALEIGTGTGNTVSVDGGGTLSVGDLIINSGNTFHLNDGGNFAVTGSFNASTTGFNWSEGGHLSVGGNLTGMAVSNSAVHLDGGRELTIDGGTWDISGTNLVVGFGANGSDLLVMDTGTLSSATAYIGWDTNSINNAVTVRDGSVWNNSGDLWVGYGADGNLLWIVNGATNALIGNAYIGNTNAANNHVLVEGSNSLWNIGGSLVIGSESNSVDNYLEIARGGKVTVGGNLTLHSDNSILLATNTAFSVGGNMNVYSNTAINGAGTITFGDNNSDLVFSGQDIGIANGIVFDGGLGNNTLTINDGTFSRTGTNALPYVNFQQLALNNSTLGGYGTLDAFDAINLAGGMIDPFGASTDTGLLVIDSDITATGGTVYSAQVYESRWDELVFTGTGAVDLSDIAAEVLVVSAPTGTVTILSATALSGSFASTNLVDRLLLYNAVLQVTNNEVQISLEADPLESSMEYAATEMIRAGFNSMKNAVFTRTKQLRRNLVSTAHSIPHEAYLLTTTNAPAGAMGPGDQNTIFDMHVWLQSYSGQGDFDNQSHSDSFTINNQGTSIGADRLIGEALTVGFNYTYARSSARTAGMDDLDTETYWLGAYGEWVGDGGLYVDAMAAVGRSNYDSQRREENYLGSASYRGQSFGAYADVGQYYYYKNLALSPYAGAHVLSMRAAGHDETDELGGSVYVGEVNRDLVESAIGLKMRHRFDTQVGRFQTTGYAEWAHDFIEDEISATLTTPGYPTVGTGPISPDADTLNVGLGYSWISTDYLEVGIGYNGRFSENYEEHAGVLMLDVMF